MSKIKNRPNFFLLILLQIRNCDQKRSKMVFGSIYKKSQKLGRPIKKVHLIPIRIIAPSL